VNFLEQNSSQISISTFFAMNILIYLSIYFYNSYSVVDLLLSVWMIILSRDESGQLYFEHYQIVLLRFCWNELRWNCGYIFRKWNWHHTNIIGWQLQPFKLFHLLPALTNVTFSVLLASVSLSNEQRRSLNCQVWGDVSVWFCCGWVVGVAQVTACCSVCCAWFTEKSIIRTFSSKWHVLFALLPG